MENVQIRLRSIECVYHYRKALTVGRQTLPVSVQLLGVEGQYYLGLRVTIFDNESVSEQGFFLLIN